MFAFSLSKGNRSLLACLAVGGCSVLATVATVKPPTKEDDVLHAKTFASVSATPQKHHRFRTTTSRSLLSGIGSWYGELFDGRPTASGEIFDQGALTACHPTLPFGTLVRVINLRNRRSVVVRINDRGIRPDRVIDLSSAAAERIGILEMGIAPVKLEVLSKERS